MEFTCGNISVQLLRRNKKTKREKYKWQLTEFTISFFFLLQILKKKKILSKQSLNLTLQYIYR